MTQEPAGPVGSLPSRRLLRNSWTRRRKLLAALLPALALVLAIVATVAVSSGGGTTSASHPVGGTVPILQTAAVTKGARWLDGSDGKALEAVNADLGRLSTAGRAGNRDAARIAGAQLAAAAKAALSGPMPPVDARGYQSALKDYERAGTYTARGDSRKAAPLLTAGTGEMTKVTAAQINPPAAVNGPAALNEPSGQYRRYIRKGYKEQHASARTRRAASPAK
jgi:hypothetical protein